VPLASTNDCVSAAETGVPTDLELVHRAQAGDMEAFGTLVDRNRRAVFRAALAAVRSAEEADEVAQDTFVTAFQKLDQFRGEAAFRTWLLAIAWRKAIDRRKGITRWLQRLAPPHTDEGHAPDMAERLAAGDRSQEDALITADLQRRIRTLVATLPPKLRDALLLAGSGEYSYEQIAAMLKIPVGTLKWRVAEARRVLKQKLAAAGYEIG
jgi:RNA polymerase sigma-70 factor (ECF subfamily)